MAIQLIQIRVLIVRQPKQQEWEWEEEEEDKEEFAVKAHRMWSIGGRPWLRASFTTELLPLSVIIASQNPPSNTHKYA